MDMNRRLARLVGGLFITGTVAGVLSAVVTGSILEDPKYLNRIAENEPRMFTGVLLVLIMAFALVMIPIVLFPLLRQYNEVLALGAVVFRGVLEAAAYLGIVISWLLLITLSQEYVKAGTPDASIFQTLGTLMVGAVDWINRILAIVFGIGALMIYYVFYTAKLIPRWLSIWGIAGAALYLATPFLSMLRPELDTLKAPLALQELVLAVWLIVRGFSSIAITAKSARQTSEV